MSRLSRSETFWVLIAASGVSAFVLPGSWTAPARNLVQSLTTLQYPFYYVASTLRGSQIELPEGEHGVEDLARRVVELERQVANQAARLRQYDRLIADLTGLRAQLPDPHSRLVIGRVVGYESTATRSVLQVQVSDGDAGNLVRTGMWVAAGQLVEPSEAERIGGHTLTQRQWLIGRVLEVRARVVTVQLATDVGFKSVQVRGARLVGPPETPVLELSAEACLIQGAGRGQMIARDAWEDYLGKGFEYIVPEPSGELPVPLLLGRIRESTPVGRGQHFNLTVEPLGAADRLTHVFILGRRSG